MNHFEDAWQFVGAEILRHLGRPLVGHCGGDYVMSSSMVAVPDRDVEAAVHELCHWIVATEDERRTPNLGLSEDWHHPGYKAMVLAEERAWLLEFDLFGATPRQVASIMTTESIRSGAGSPITRLVGYDNVAEAARAQSACYALQEPYVRRATLHANAVAAAASVGVDIRAYQRRLRPLVSGLLVIE